MARHCLFYAIQYDDHDVHPDFNEGWYTGVAGPFRATPAEAKRRYEEAEAEAPPNLSVRLIECRVLEQRHGKATDPK